MTKEGALSAAQKKEEGKEKIGKRIGETIKKAAEKVKEEFSGIKEKKEEIRRNALKETAVVLESTNRNVLSIQPMLASAAVKKRYKRTSEETAVKVSSEKMNKVLEGYARTAVGEAAHVTRVQDVFAAEKAASETASDVKEAAETSKSAQSEIVNETKSGYSSYIYESRLFKGGKRGRGLGSAARILGKSIDEKEAEKKAIKLCKESGLSDREAKALSEKARRDGVSAEGISALLTKAKEEGVSAKDLYSAIMGENTRSVAEVDKKKALKLFKRVLEGGFKSESLDLKEVLQGLDSGLRLRELVSASQAAKAGGTSLAALLSRAMIEIGRASCRERV